MCGHEWPNKQRILLKKWPQSIAKIPLRRLLASCPLQLAYRGTSQQSCIIKPRRITCFYKLQMMMAHEWNHRKLNISVSLHYTDQVYVCRQDLFFITCQHASLSQQQIRSRDSPRHRYCFPWIREKSTPIHARAWVHYPENNNTDLWWKIALPIIFWQDFDSSYAMATHSTSKHQFE